MFTNNRDDYLEPSLADEILNEYSEKMKNLLRNEVKYSIEIIKDENNLLKKQYDSLKEKVEDIERRERELKYKEDNLERDFYKKKITDIIKPFINNIEVYSVEKTSHKQPKCEYCDEDRNIVFTASNGQTITEKCRCDKCIYYHKPSIARLLSFELYLDKGNGLTVLPAFNHVSEKGYITSIYCDVHTMFDDYNKKVQKSIDKICYQFKFVFKTIEACQKYCDYLNNTNIEEVDE